MPAATTGSSRDAMVLPTDGGALMNCMRTLRSSNMTGYAAPGKRRTPDACKDRAISGRKAIRILEADDVVLAEVGAGLHLDDLERQLARIREAVRLAERDVGALVLGQDHLAVAAGDLRGALHDDPVLGAMVVHLQAQRGTRVDQDALDLEAGAGVH